MNIWKLSWNYGYVVVSTINTFSMNQNGLLITSLCLTLNQNISQHRINSTNNHNVI